jgi:hypothetical protein
MFSSLMYVLDMFIKITIFYTMCRLRIVIMTVSTSFVKIYGK